MYLYLLLVAGIDAYLAYTLPAYRTAAVFSWWHTEYCIIVDGLYVFVFVFILVFAMAASAIAHRAVHRTVEHYVLTACMLSTGVVLVVVDDMIAFYALFECMLLLIYGYLHQYTILCRATYAMYMLTAYTIAGSSMLCIGVATMYMCYGTTTATYTTAYSSYQYGITMLCALSIHVGMYCKIPCWPLQAWLTEAHVESSTDGSIILAGVYLKVGIIGWYRYVMCSQHASMFYCMPVFMLSGIVGTCALTALLLYTVDTKRFAAASSIVHMQIATMLCIWMQHRCLLVGVLLQLVAHSWIAAALFYMLGDVYELHGIRSARSLYTYHSTATALLLVLLANSGYPCTISYYAEWLLIAHALSVSLAIGMLIAGAAGALATCGLMMWAQLSSGQSRLCTGLTTSLSTSSSTILCMYLALLASTVPSTYADAVLINIL
nr:NADH dehydrogenase subunit 4 [Diplonema ambulator]